MSGDTGSSTSTSALKTRRQNYLRVAGLVVVGVLLIFGVIAALTGEWDVAFLDLGIVWLFVMHLRD